MKRRRRRKCRHCRTKLSRSGKPGRPALSKELRALIVRMSKSNPGWGSPRIVGELQKLGIQVANSTVEKYKVYGTDFRKRVRGLDIEEILTALRSPWQSPYVERIIGSIRRECLDHVIVLNERHLKRVISNYLDYYHHWRTHLSLAMDTPDPRPIQGPERGRVVESPKVGGLHHHYERLAA